MKKALLMAACLMLTGVFLVNGTLAADFSKAVSNIFAELTDKLGEIIGTPQQGGNIVDVTLITDDIPQQLFPGGTAEQTSVIRNDGQESVFFRLAYAVQYDVETWDDLEINFSFDNEDYLVYPSKNEWKDISVHGTSYRMKVFTYPQVLAVGAVSPEVKICISMNTAVTSAQISRYRHDFLQVQALAIEAEAFASEYSNTTAEQALNMALPITETFNPF